ncbi:related to Reticuline oxidase precursor [Sporisorium scitamineum]|uniref:Related to Reticuline oxidase n=1 Tax=Sporisorium scitamineum TaxID=49012 RepID=A0A127ZIG1_9BASI|nr:related to Reticuline oxidase precursor [Sporisorium scitamineum]
MLTPTNTLSWALLALTTATLTTLTPRSDNTTSTLQTCLSQSGGYERSYPTSSTYPTLSSYNPIFTYKPLVIAVPSTVDEISSIIKCVAAENGKQKLTPRSGGHSYKAYSLGGHDGSVVVDLRLLDDVTVDEIAKTATVGAGVRLGRLAEQIWEQGGFALPHGTCLLVGVAGHALGGGFGYTTRAWGFLLDRITEMKMVDVNGTVQTVDRDTNGDLWWALRGAGSNNFGIVTEFTFFLVDAPTAILNYTYSYKTNVDCAKAIVALQNMTLSTDAATGFEPGFGSELLIAGESAGDFDGNACQLSGQHIDTTQPDHDQLIHRFHTLANITPASSTFTPFTTWIHSLQNIMGNLSITSQINSDHEQFYAKSLVQPPIVTYTYDSALALVDKLNSYAGLQGTGNSISFDFLGPLSYSSREKEGAAVFNARRASFVYQFYSYGFPGDGEGQREVWEAFDELVETAKGSGGEGVVWGAYVNYVDRRERWAEAYYGDGVERLKGLKERWDGEDVFWFPQGLSSA